MISSSAIMRKNFNLHRWSELNFSSQLKQRPFSRRATISKGDRCLKVVLGGAGSRGGKGGAGTVFRGGIFSGGGLREWNGRLES